MKCNDAWEELREKVTEERLLCEHVVESDNTFFTDMKQTARIEMILLFQLEKFLDQLEWKHE